MKAALVERYGPPGEVVAVKEVARPEPGEGEVLIAVRAASVNPMDAHFIKGRPYPIRLAFGLRRPKRTRPGSDVAGIVEAVGAGVTRFKPGDAVFGVCAGAIAEHACAAEGKLAPKPDRLSFAEAAALPVAGVSALQGLRDFGRLQSGQSVLVNGASGGVGSFAVQITRAMGATVTGVCSARNAAAARALGAERTIDYAAEDFRDDGTRYDLILDCVGNLWFPTCRRALSADGVLVACGAGAGIGRMIARVLSGLIVSRFGRRKLKLLMAKITPEDLAALAAMEGIVPAIDRTYPLDEAAAAIGYVATGHARAKVIVEVAT
jgi:NADPH:quinone reductase-like Zn-dependent oxidoreductase